MSDERKPLALESVVALAEHLCHEECEHDPEMGGHCADCTEGHLCNRDRELVRRAWLEIADTSERLCKITRSASLANLVDCIRALAADPDQIDASIRRWEEE